MIAEQGHDFAGGDGQNLMDTNNLVAAPRLTFIFSEIHNEVRIRLILCVVNHGMGITFMFCVETTHPAHHRLDIESHTQCSLPRKHIL
jgi:hypothetical protein